MGINGRDPSGFESVYISGKGFVDVTTKLVKYTKYHYTGWFDFYTHSYRSLTEWRCSISRKNIGAERAKFLGDDFVKIDKGIWRSKNGLRQFRSVPSDYLGTHGIGRPLVPDTPHVHFEFLAPPNAGGLNPKLLKNIHIPLVN